MSNTADQPDTSETTDISDRLYLVRWSQHIRSLDVFPTYVYTNARLDVGQVPQRVNTSDWKFFDNQGTVISTPDLVYDASNAQLLFTCNVEFWFPPEFRHVFGEMEGKTDWKFVALGPYLADNGREDWEMDDRTDGYVGNSTILAYNKYVQLALPWRNGTGVALYRRVDKNPWKPAHVHPDSWHNNGGKTTFAKLFGPPEKTSLNYIFCFSLQAECSSIMVDVIQQSLLESWDEDKPSKWARFYFGPGTSLADDPARRPAVLAPVIITDSSTATASNPENLSYKIYVFYLLRDANDRHIYYVTIDLTKDGYIKGSNQKGAPLQPKMLESHQIFTQSRFQPDAGSSLSAMLHKGSLWLFYSREGKACYLAATLNDKGLSSEYHWGSDLTPTENADSQYIPVVLPYNFLDIPM